MRIIQKQFISDGWHDIRADEGFSKPQLTIVFGAKEQLRNRDRYQEVRDMFPDGCTVFCTTAGEILNTKVYDDTICITAIEFGSSHVESYQVSIERAEDSTPLGKQLGEKLTKDGLKHVMIFMDGQIINADDIMRGIQSALPESVAVTGGLAGGGLIFTETFVGLNDFPEKNKVIVIGFYGENLAIGHGSVGGWDAFGVSRLVTKSSGNIVYELDHKPILDIYREYLGDQSKDLPVSGLFFPLNVKLPNSDSLVVRTMMGVNETDGSVRFAGNIPEGSYAQLMKANINRLIEGAQDAAKMGLTLLPDHKAQLAIMINCFGRRLVFRQRTEEEVEEVSSIFGSDCFTTGFYSYGEITPDSAIAYKCQLQNQTMTITTLNEK